MTYWGVLLRFLVPPLLLVFLVTVLPMIRQLRSDGNIQLKPYLIVFLHVLLALFYTSPWDNYLVAESVWWYEPRLVSGILLGYVPIEEYTFFILQTMLTGLLTLVVLKRDPAHFNQEINQAHLRLRSSALVLVMGFMGGALLFLDWESGRYLGLILAWAALPMLIQSMFGGDILFLHWRTLMVAVLVPTLYLWFVDTLAINAGTWTISEQYTTGLKLGILPIEEMTFFLVTNWIVVAGVLLMLSPSSQQRADQIIEAFKAKRTDGSLSR